MRDSSSKKKSSQQSNQRGALPNRKSREVTVVKHFQPSPTRQLSTNIPKVRYLSELPENSKYFPLHPVFKFVENFFNNTATAVGQNICGTMGRTIGTLAKRKTPGRPLHKCACFPPKSIRYAGDDVRGKSLVQQKSIMSCGVNQSVSHEQQNRVSANLANINNNSELRVSLNKICPNCQQDDDVPEVNLIPNNSTVIAPKSRVSMDSDFYVEQLKNEIRQVKNNIGCPPEKSVANYIQKLKAQYCLEPDPLDLYVQKLKDELSCNKSKCMEDTRNVINALKDEILTYRLQAKTKYSSSCSNISCVDKNAPTPVQNSAQCTPVESRQIGESPEGTKPHCLDLTQDDSPRCKPRFETIWHSKVSLQSSTDIESTSFIHEINFDEKLEEAHMLIEKVRAALRDIGKGIHNVPDLRKLSSNFEKPKACAEICADVSCNYRNECLPKQHEMEMFKDVKVPDKKVEVGKSKAERTGTTRKSKEKERLATSKATSKKKEKKGKQAKEEKTVATKAEEVTLQDIAIRNGDVETKEATREISESMEVLQEKLKSISEGTESDAAKSEELRVPVSRMERASSPIDFTAESTPPCPCDEKKEEDGLKKILKTPDHSPAPSYYIESATDKKMLFIRSADTIDDDIPREDSQKKMRVPSIDKSAKLSVQIMPPVNIQGSLVMQKTVHISIKPTGSVTNIIEGAQPNVGYHEINVQSSLKQPVVSDEPEKPLKCPAKCKAPTAKKRISISTDVTELNADAILLYKSYQIYGDQDISGLTRPSSKDVVRTSQVLEQSLKSHRSPLEMGFYKCQATQCTESSLTSLDLREMGDSDQSPIVSQIPVSEEKVENVIEKTSVKVVVPIKSETSSQKSRSSSISSSQRSVPEVTSNQMTPDSQSNSVDVPSKSESDEVYSKSESDEVHSKAASNEVQAGFEEQTPVKEIPTSSTISEKEVESTDKVKVPEKPSVAPSSDSSCTVQGSFSNIVDTRYPPDATTAQVHDLPAVGVKRRHPSESEENIAEVAKVQKEPKPEPPKVPQTEPKPEVPSKPHAQIGKEKNKIDTDKELKVDENIQVFLGSSSEEEDVKSVDYSDREDRLRTIQSFIKGLTGTSEEQLQSFRSNHSFPKTWSKNMSLQKLAKPDKATEEEVIESHDYSHAELSHDKGANPLKELNSLVTDTNDKERGDKKTKEEIIMRLQQEEGNSGEGAGNIDFLPKREAPFYRRVLGKIIESSGSKKPMQKSFSDATPVMDNSISEGEVMFQTSLASQSIGEVVTQNYDKKKKKVRMDVKNINRYREELHRKELDDNTTKITRERIQYNQWVNRYLQKHSKLQFNDSSSTSYDSSPKK